MTQLMVRPTSNITSGSAEPWVASQLTFHNQTEEPFIARQRSAEHDFSSYVTILLRAAISELQTSRRHIEVRQGLANLRTTVNEIEHLIVPANAELDALARKALASIKSRKDEAIDAWAENLTKNPSKWND
jgi:hypothetical protein